MSEVVVRALLPEDEAAARALLSQHYAGTRYHARFVELLRLAVDMVDAERAIVVTDAGLAGLALFGSVAGTHDVVRLHCIAAPSTSIAARLLRTVVSLSAAGGSRLIVCECSTERDFAPGVALLTANGYVPEGRVKDYFGIGIDLCILTTEIDPTFVFK